ncbi:MAG: hypothetical protein KKF46_02440 [Nanoarchaeota archaeon]|nr:hypothetical protein [Nanoarchaeota archaeon]MBU1321191.1 hypothetical protein [Nanoarchaeota archaeon]MBU1598459.1 hypothetical protein [Nanoarchaeota archaeon]MBU2441392.1 hypothetical protein [Nanoarchaeota archaeon]
MKLANNIKVSVFVKPEDDEDKMKKKFISLFPFDLEKEKIVLQQSKATGFNQRKVIILEVDLEKERHTRSFLESFVSKLNDQQKTMLVSQDNRIDDECNFFLRLDKQKLLDDEFWITDSGECFHVKINIAAFPKKKEKAKDVVKEIFS